MSEVEPLPARSTDDKFDDPIDIIDAVKKLREFRKFWKTRSAVLQAIPLHDYGKRKLDEEGYLGPWKFNLFQSTLCGLPVLLLPIGKQLLGYKNNSDASANHSMVAGVYNFSLPFILMLVAFAVGRASLWKSDATKNAKKRAARAFLYLDGAYGLLPQLLFVTVATISSLMSMPVPVAFSGWQLYVSMVTIPEQLFPILGYSGSITADGAPLSISANAHMPNIAMKVRETPPVWKYRFCILLAFPIINITVRSLIALIAVNLKPLMSRGTF